MDLVKLLRGDKQVWDDFVDSSGRVVYAAVLKVFYCRGGRVNEQDVEDAVQSVFVRLIKDDFRLLRSYDPSRAALSTWLTIVARSVALDLLKRRSVVTVSLDDLATDLPDRVRPDEARLEFPPDLLSPRQKLVLHLVFDRNMEIPEVADLLRVDPQTVRSTKHKAIVRLREYLAEKGT